MSTPALRFLWGGIGWLLDTQVQLVELLLFERPNGSIPNGTQHNGDG